MINFSLAAIGAGVVTAFINRAVRNEVGLLITVLHFGLRQISLLALISVAVAAVSSFLPVRRIAAKRPIDAIRNRYYNIWEQTVAVCSLAFLKIENMLQFNLICAMI
jgi:hypothetical protein